RSPTLAGTQETVSMRVRIWSPDGATPSSGAFYSTKANRKLQKSCRSRPSCRQVLWFIIRLLVLQKRTRCRRESNDCFHQDPGRNRKDACGGPPGRRSPGDDRAIRQGGGHHRGAGSHLPRL